ncbi:UTP15 C terminal-domain-containing protein [Dipodascopsis uninucleata]
MSAPLLAPEQIRTAVIPRTVTPEYRFWRQFKTPLVVKEHASILHIAFSNSAPHDFAVTEGARVQIFSGKTRQVVRTFARFKSTAYSGEFRSDGRLLVAGDATGQVQAFDPHSRAVLVSLNPSSLPTQVTKFHPTVHTTLLTASDDKVVRLYDISSSEPTNEFRCHNDYVRTATFLNKTDNTVLSGSYDGIVRLLDSRSGKASMELKIGTPIESVCALSSTTAAASAGPDIFVYDLVAGKLVRKLSNFQKTVSTLCATTLSADESSGPAILAGALDGHVKLFDASTTWDVKFGWKFGDAVLTAAIGPDHRHLVTGLVSGLVSIRSRKAERTSKPKIALKAQKSNAFARMIRGSDYKGVNEHEILIDRTERRRKLRVFEKHLNAFRWSDALDAAFMPGTPSDTTATVLVELSRRGKIRIALSGRDDGQLEPLLKWAVQNIYDVRNTNLIADYVSCVVDMYAGIIEKSPVLDSLVVELQKNLSRQVELAKEASRLDGMLSLLLHAGSSS